MSYPEEELDEAQKEAEKAEEIERTERIPDYVTSPRHMGLVTVEYACKRCGLSFEAAYPDEESIPDLRRIWCPVRRCKGRLEVQYDERYE